MKTSQNKDGRSPALALRVVRLARAFERAEANVNKQREKLDEAFRPLVDDAYKTGGEEAAFAVARQIPCCVTRAFAFDRIRHVLPNK